MDLDRFKQDVGHSWKWLAEGWRHISDKAASALTYFTPGNRDAEPGLRWGLLAVDMSVDADAVRIELEVPGLDKDDLDIDVHGQRLVVTGRKTYEAHRKEGSRVISERAFGHFQRIVPLPEEVAVEASEARYRNGVLTVTLPKRTPVRARRIPVGA